MTTVPNGTKPISYKGIIHYIKINANNLCGMEKNENWDLKTPTIKGDFETAIERFTKKPKQKNQVTNLIVNFANFKYNVTNQWEKLKDDYQWSKHRLKAINNGELTPLSDINHYLKIKDEVPKKLICIKLANNLEVKTISYHFVDRVIGCIEQRRSGVKIDNIVDSLNGNYDVKEIDKSIKIYGLDNIVAINKETGRLIQVNPHTRRKNEFNRKTD